MSFPILCAECGRQMEQQDEFDHCINASCDFFLVPVNEEEVCEDTANYWTDYDGQNRRGPEPRAA